MPGIDSVVFDVGGVLLDWNPRHLYRTLFDDDASIERFLAETALHEWPAETADELRSSYEFFDWFDGVVISGEERLAKPDRALFERLCDRYAVDPHTSVFVDDVAANTAAAAALGFSTVLFRSPDQLRRELSLLLASDPA